MGTTGRGGEPVSPSSVADLVLHAEQLAAARPRTLLGITGSPGAGKSTLAAALVDGLRARGVQALVVPMDGFHLAQVELRRLGREDRKGAPDTFDAAGFVALLRRLREQGGGHGPGSEAAGDGGHGQAEVVYAPAFHREIEEPVAGSIPVGPEVRLVVTEGNYLLLPQPPWREVRDLLDEVWYVEADESERLRRLADRHERFGKSRAAAEAWTHGPDERNAELVRSTRGAADLVVPGTLLAAAGSPPAR